MYPKPPAPESSNINSFQFQSATIVNGDDNTSYNGGAAGGAHGVGAHGGGELPTWSTVVKPPATSCLIRQSSSQPAFLHQQLAFDFGIADTKGDKSYNHPQALSSSHKHKQPRLSSDQLSFIKHDSVNSRHLSSNVHPSLKKASTSSTSSSSRGFTISPWEECNSIVFDTAYDPQVRDLSEIGTIDNLLVPAPKDLVAWRIRAKRGFATDPRSIAERKRRTMINCKLKKLQEILPNIDKQTSYAEMLDLAVEHVKGLQCQIQGLNEELDHCTCGCMHNE